MDKPYQFLTDCVHSTAEAICAMTDQAHPITYETLLRHVPIAHVRRIPPFTNYTRDRRSGLTLKADWAVRYYRSAYQGERCYYIDHSGIEYIFTRQEATDHDRP